MPVARRVLPALGAVSITLATAAAGPLAGRVNLPPGFRIRVYAPDVPGARSLARAPDGTVFVGTRNRGVVYAVRDPDGDGFAQRVQVVAARLNSPNGVAFRDGALYVAEVHRVSRYPGILAALDRDEAPARETVKAGLPKDRGHGWKFIRFGPDGKLYVPIGAPCNVCDRGDPYAAIHRMDPDGKNFEVFARGVRNTVGFDFDPATGHLWFTDNGRDMMGDDIPPDELNHAPRPGLHFGYPYRHAKAVVDPEYGDKLGDRAWVPPAVEFGAHVAPLGMRFYTGRMFPPEYRGQIFVAEHGSWNRSVPQGYRVSLVRLEGGEATGWEVFADGWLRGGQRWGRPVDLMNMPDGSLLLSDDLAGVVYRIDYAPPGGAK